MTTFCTIEGSIGPSELLQLLHAIGVMATGDEVDALVHEVDDDCSGEVCVRRPPSFKGPVNPNPNTVLSPPQSFRPSLADLLSDAWLVWSG